MCDTEEFNMFLANLEEFVFDEDKIVSIGWLSKTLDIHITLAKRLLSTFINDNSFKSKLFTSWFLMGTPKSNPSARKMLIVSSDQLESAKEMFDKVSSEHIYSIQKCGNNQLDMNSIYLADQSAGKNIAQCPSLSNIKCDQVKIVENRRSIIAAESSSANTKPTSNVKATNKAEDKTSKPADKKSPVKSTLGNMFNKKNEEMDKKKKEEASKKEADKTKEDSGDKKESTSKREDEKKESMEKKSAVSPVKKSAVSPVKKTNTGAGKKKGAEKGAGSANITSFFSKGPLPEMKKPELSTKKSPVTNEDTRKETKHNSETKNASKSNGGDARKESKSNGNAKKDSKSNGDGKKESKRTKAVKTKEEDEEMEVDEPDENKEPEERVENVNKGKKQKEDKKETTNSKKSNKASNKGKKNEKKEKESQRRRRIQVFSDSSDSEQEEPLERERSPSPPPPSPPRLNIQSDDDDDVIPPTPEPQSNGGGRKRKRKLVTKTMTDESGFLRTVKEFETVSCSDSDGESTAVKQDTKKPKVQEETKVKSPPAQKPPLTNQKSPAKTKQTSILSFFKKS